MTTPKQSAIDPLVPHDSVCDIVGAYSTHCICGRAERVARIASAIEAEAAAGLLALQQALADVYDEASLMPEPKPAHLDLLLARADIVLKDTAPAAAEIEARIGAPWRDKVERLADLNHQREVELGRYAHHTGRWQECSAYACRYARGEQPATEEAE